MRSKYRCSCVLQFTRFHTVSCVLHRSMSRVIPRIEFVKVCLMTSPACISAPDHASIVYVCTISGRVRSKKWGCSCAQYSDKRGRRVILPQRSVSGLEDRLQDVTGFINITGCTSYPTLYALIVTVCG